MTALYVTVSVLLALSWSISLVAAFMAGKVSAYAAQAKAKEKLFHDARDFLERFFKPKENDYARSIPATQPAPGLAKPARKNRSTGTEAKRQG